MLVKDFIETMAYRSDVSFTLISGDGWINSGLDKESALKRDSFIQSKVSAWSVREDEDRCCGVIVTVWSDIIIET